MSNSTFKNTNSTSKNIIKRKPLLMYFVFAFAFFWLFLILTLVFLTNVLGLEMSPIPTWVFIASTIIGSWMPSLAAAVVFSQNNTQSHTKVSTGAHLKSVY